MPDSMAVIPANDHVKTLEPTNSITNDFVGLSNIRPITIYSFPHTEHNEFTFVDSNCALRQTGITERYLSNLDSPPHDHEFYEITIVRGGTAIHQTNWGELPVSRGAVMVVPPGEVHGFTELDGFSVTDIYYQSEWFSDDLRILLKEDGLVPLFLAGELYNVPHLRRVYEFRLDEEALGSCVREIVDICDSIRKGSAHVLFANLCFLKMLVILSKAYCLAQDSVRKLPFRPETWALIEEMEQSLVTGVPFSLAESAEHLRLSKKYLSRLFVKDVGLRPIQYFQRRRGQHAARMLVTTHTSITDVAYSLCYTDSSHFCNQFHRQYGISPSDYRKRFRA